MSISFGWQTVLLIKYFILKALKIIFIVLRSMQRSCSTIRIVLVQICVMFVTLWNCYGFQFCLIVLLQVKMEFQCFFFLFSSSSIWFLCNSLRHTALFSMNYVPRIAGVRVEILFSNAILFSLSPSAFRSSYFTVMVFHPSFCFSGLKWCQKRKGTQKWRDKQNKQLTKFILSGE